MRKRILLKTLLPLIGGFSLRGIYEYKGNGHLVLKIQSCNNLKYSLTGYLMRIDYENT